MSPLVITALITPGIIVNVVFIGNVHLISITRVLRMAIAVITVVVMITYTASVLVRRAMFQRVAQKYKLSLDDVRRGLNLQAWREAMSESSRNGFTPDISNFLSKPVR